MRAAGGWGAPAHPGVAAGQLQCLVRRPAGCRLTPKVGDSLRDRLAFAFGKLRPAVPNVCEEKQYLRIGVSESLEVVESVRKSSVEKLAGPDLGQILPEVGDDRLDGTLVGGISDRPHGVALLAVLWV